MTSASFESRLSRLLSALWGGALLAVALIAAPAVFATLERALAGRAAGRMFAVEAPLSLAVGVALLILQRRAAEQRALRGEGSRFSVDVGLVLVALFCVVAGYYALQPLMEQARVGLGPYSFGALHGISTVFYGIKTAAVLLLAWRLAR